jgi:hypothetical protein
MKKTEIILIGIFIIGVLLMLFSFPGQGILMVLGLGILAIIYTFFGFALLNNIRLRNIFKKDNYQDISTARILGSIIAGLSLAIALNGILFKLMFWPASNLLLIDGIVFLMIITIVGAIKYTKNKSAFYPKLFKRTITISMLALFLLLLPSEKLVNIKYRNNPKYAKALLDSWANPENIEYQKRFKEERDKMEDENNGA